MKNPPRVLAIIIAIILLLLLAWFVWHDMNRSPEETEPSDETATTVSPPPAPPASEEEKSAEDKEAAEHVEKVAETKAEPIRPDKEEVKQFTGADQTVRTGEDETPEKEQVASGTGQQQPAAAPPPAEEEEEERTPPIAPPPAVPAKEETSDTDSTASAGGTTTGSSASGGSPAPSVSTTVGELFERSGQMCLGREGDDTHTRIIEETRESEGRSSVPEDAVFYVHTVNREDHQGIWGILHTALNENFARGIPIRQDDGDTRTYQVELPPTADEMLPNRRSSKLGILIHQHSESMIAYNYRTGRLRKDPNIIYPDEELLIACFRREELIDLYKHFTGSNGQ